jgi:hypothetical protein
MARRAAANARNAKASARRARWGVRKDVADFRASLLRALHRNAEGLTGQQVVMALKAVSDDVYDSGVDEAYVRVKPRRRKNLADAWDLTWMSVLNVQLRRMQPRARRRRGRERPKSA